MSNEVKFRVISQDGKARAGELFTPHGKVHTPAFLPVGSLGAVKTLSPEELRQAGVEMILGNTYHLYHHPGVELIRRVGGLSRFMGWSGPTLTDSGGFQVFSLTTTRRLVEDGVTFKSVYTGDEVLFSPEKVYHWQRAIGADIIYALDVCPPYPSSFEELTEAVRLTTLWAKRFMTQALGDEDRERVGVFLVVQGGLEDELRIRSAEELIPLEPDGFGVGGVSVGEPPEEVYRIAHLTGEILPPDRPRHLMGVGRPKDLLEAIGAGFDLFDCVLPTRNGRNGQAFTSQGVLNLRLAHWKEIDRPLDENCLCPVCRTFSCSYLHHLLSIGEILGLRLLSLHNISYYQHLIQGAREAIITGQYDSWRREVEECWGWEKSFVS